MNIFFIE